MVGRETGHELGVMGLSLGTYGLPKKHGWGRAADETKPPVAEDLECKTRKLKSLKQGCE